MYKISYSKYFLCHTNFLGNQTEHKEKFETLNKDFRIEANKPEDAIVGGVL